MAAEIPEMKGFFMKQNFIRKFSKGELICAQDDKFKTIYMINSGMVKSYDIDDTGTERTLSIFAGSSIFPLIWLIQPAPDRHLYFYEAFTDVTCFAANKDEAFDFTQEHPEVLRGVVDALAKAYTHLAERIRSLERSRIHERLEYVLLMLATSIGTVRGNVSDIDAPITQEDISRLAGVTRESISLAMNEARSRSLIWKTGQRTYIDISKLKGGEEYLAGTLGAASV